MGADSTGNPRFPGFPALRANVTFVPIQFFTHVVPHCSRGTVRVVGYVLRQILGWVDCDGNPTRDRLELSYRELVEKAGVSRDSIGPALDEAIEKKFLTCLRDPAPDISGKRGQSGLYGIRWDETGPYTNDSQGFKGFYYPEAAIVEEVEDGCLAPRPKAARKNIPNAFFDYLLPREPLSVVRVVGALMFYGIQWGKGGERRVDVTKSITELSCLTRISRHHVHAAVVRARGEGYIVQVSPGRFDRDAGAASESASYAIRWTELAASAAGTTTWGPVGKGVRDEGNRSEKVHGGPVQNGERDRSEKVNGKESEKVNDIRVKTGILKSTTAAVAAEVSRPSPCVGDADEVIERLRSLGFDIFAAREIATKHPAEVIRRQIDWMPLRAAKRNPLGLLRRAIEQDWPVPAAARQSSSADPAAVTFASNYYAGYHGNPGPAETQPGPKDIEAAGGFLARLRKLGGSGQSAAEMGRRFGSLVRGRHQASPGAFPHLSLTVVAFGDLLLADHERRQSSQTRGDDERAAKERERRFLASYLEFLATRETHLREARPELMAAFDRGWAESLKKAPTGKVCVPEKWLKACGSEANRLEALAVFLERHPEHRIPDFEEWVRRSGRTHADSAVNAEVRV